MSMAVGGQTVFDVATDEQHANRIKKYSFNMYESDINMLRELVGWGSASNVTQALRAAIATEHFLRSTMRRGERLFLESGDGDKREIIFK